MNRMSLSKLALWLALAALAMLLVSCSSEDDGQATTYYISPSGSDEEGKGTQKAPWKTLAYAAQHVPENAGHTIRMEAGIYEETLQTVLPLGVNLEGAGPEETILKSNIPVFLIKLTSSVQTDGNQTLSGFQIDGMDKSLEGGVWVEGRNNVVLHHLKFNRINDRGTVIVAKSGLSWMSEPPYYLTGIKVYETEFIDSANDYQDFSTGNLNIGGLDGAQIHHIKVTDSVGYGIKFAEFGYFRNTSIYQCEIQVNEEDPIWGEDISVELWNLSEGNELYEVNANTWFSIVNTPGFYKDGKKSITVRDNRIIGTKDNSVKEAIEIGTPGTEIYNNYIEQKGIGIAIWDGARKDISIHHNIFSNRTHQRVHWSDSSGVLISNARDFDYSNISIYNNVFHKYQTGVMIENLGTESISDIRVQNNVFLETTKPAIRVKGDAISEVAVSHNLLSGSSWTGENRWFNAPDPGLISLTDNLESDPLFTGTGEKWGGYYRPLPGSDLIDNGMDVEIPFEGAAPDIGRYEIVQ